MVFLPDRLIPFMKIRRLVGDGVGEEGLWGNTDEPNGPLSGVRGNLTRDSTPLT
jgi:hypothetical protein